MSPEQWQQVREVLGEALEQKTEDWPAFLDRACSSNPWLREEVELLLSSSDEARSNFLQTTTLQITLTPGAKLGDYEVRGLLGSGGMGEVYRGRDTRLGREVAIKVLPAFLSHDPDRLRRFEQEARAVAALNHPNILAVFQMGTYEGAPYLVSELLEGGTLREHIVRGPLSVRKTIDWGVQIARGLAAAHEKGTVHRDLKPENLFVMKDGRVKILDFGLAKLTQPQSALTSGATTASARTEPGVVMGTIGYMSPEQVRGEAADPRTDIFAFGAVLYEMLSGKRAFQKPTSAETLTAILNEDPAPISQLVAAIAPPLQRIVHRCLERNPEQRFQSASDLAFALEALSDSGSPSAKCQVSSRRISRWVAAALGLVVMSLAVAAMLWLRSRPSSESTKPLPKTAPLTSFPGREIDPALSPDGRFVAFAWDGEGANNNFEIYIKQIDAGDPLRLTTNPADDFGPAWSPDGRYVAFYRQSQGGNEIMMVPALGGSERKLGESAGLDLSGSNEGFLEASRSRPAWSPDGKSVAIVERASAQAPLSIFLLSIETGDKKKLTSPPAGYGDRSPTFSPDGRMLAFARIFSLQSKEIFVLPVAHNGAPVGEPVRVTFDERNIPGLDWTPDSLGIVFSSAREDGRSLWRVSVDPRGPKAPQRLVVGTENAYSPSTAGEASRVTRLVYAQQIQDTNIWRVEGPLSPVRGSATGRAVSPVKLIASTRMDDTAQVSPDGKKIAFGSSRSGNHELWVCGNDGLNSVQLTTFGGPPAGSPRWSPDGQRIAFDSVHEGHRDVYVIRAEGGAARRLTTEPSDEVRPSWSGNGRWIYFGSNRTGTWQVWRLPSEGGPAVQVTRNGGREALESPDGRSVYYHKRDVPGIWRVPVEGGEETQVLDIGNQGGWAIIEQGLFLITTRKTSGPVIQFFRPSTSQLAEVVTLPKETRIYPTTSHLTVCPDGRWLLYTQVDSIESDLTLVENFQ